MKTNSDVKDVLNLRSIDNLSIIVLEKDVEGLREQDQLKESLDEVILNSVDWIPSLQVWKEVYQFQKCDIETVLNSNAENADIKPKFRVTCNRDGKDHKFTSMEAASLFGGALNDKYFWPVSMKEYDMEVVLNIKNNRVTIGIALTQKSLHFRNLVAFGPTTMRSTICYNMLRLAEIGPGDTVCDLMCGSGAIPLESSINWPTAFNIANESHEKGIENTFGQLHCV